MKKLLFVLSGFVLLSVFVLPTTLARKPALVKPAPRLASAKHTPPAPVIAPPQEAQQLIANKGAEAFTTAPGVPFNPKQLPPPRPASLRIEEEAEEAEAEDSVESDIDPVTLRRLKQQPWRAPQTPPLYTEQQDRAAQPKDGRQPLALAQALSFAGVGNDEQPDGSHPRPPDTDMAAGPNHIVTVVNSMYAVYDKTGMRLQLNSLFSLYGGVCPTCAPFDPRVVYDPVANHWIIMALHLIDTTTVKESYVLVAVSQTPDPTGAWWSYKLDATLNFNGENTWSDYPDLSFDGIPADQGGAVYITTNQFTFTTKSSRTAALFILPKSALYTGQQLNFWRASDHHNADGSQAFTLRAAKTYGNDGGEYLINTRNVGSSVSIWRVVPTYPPNPVNWTLQATIPIGAYSPAPSARQLGCSNTLDTIDNRIYSAVWRNNHLYAAFTEAHDWGGGGGTVAAIRYLKINTTSNVAELNQVYGADGSNYFFPALAPDSSDNIVLIFARSGAGEFGSLRYTGRLTIDTTTQSSSLLKAGVQCLTGARYGDYQAAAIDPADGRKVWIYGEWAADLPGVSSVSDWGTWVGQVQFDNGPSCNYSIAPTTVGAPAAGTTGSINVTTSCAWTATSSAPWLTITAGASGNGSGTISYSVAANTSGAPRAAAITIADQIFTITQRDASCTDTPLTFGQTVNGTLATTDCRATFRGNSYTDSYSFQAGAGQQIAISMSSTAFDTYLYLLGPTGTITAENDDIVLGVNTNSRIPVNGFLTLPAAGTYTIEATSFDANAIGNYTLTLTGQAACTYTITPTARNFTASGGSDMVGVTTSAGCTWTASNNGNTWITITSGASGTGSGPVNYTVAANPNTSPRTGTMTIAGQTFAVTQDAAPCVYTLAPTAQSFTAAPATSSVGVTANDGCTWTAVSNSNFITITAGSSGNGNGSVNYSVTQNTTTSQRTGTMTIAGQTFTVTQAAVANSTCTPAAISFGQTINSTLATSDCRATFRNGSYADRYTFNGIAGQQISISLSSAASDTYL
jgi:Bacterial pre-peptidase C-terminal domain/Putative binding domain, N-terminal/Viral BACON domain